MVSRGMGQQADPTRRRGSAGELLPLQWVNCHEWAPGALQPPGKPVDGGWEHEPLVGPHLQVGHSRRFPEQPHGNVNRMATNNRCVLTLPS